MHSNLSCVSIHCMTNFERTKQTIAVFENAGRIAFGMQIPIGNNPYPKTDKNGVAEPSNLAWDRGYKAAEEEAFLKEHPRKPRLVERKPLVTKKWATIKHKKDTRPPANPPRWKGARPEAGRAK